MLWALEVGGWWGMVWDVFGIWGVGIASSLEGPCVWE